MRIDVSIVIGHNEKLIFLCLESIYQQTKKCELKIFVVDNGAKEETINKIKDKFPEITIIKNNKLKGFAENHNNVIRKTNSKYILILNDDTIILDNAIDKLVDYMEHNQQVGVVAPKLLNPDLTLQPSIYGFPNLLKDFLNISGLRKLIPLENNLVQAVARIILGKYKTHFWDHNLTTEVDTFRGAFMLVRRKTIEEVGLMDEITLAHGEEMEWHCRMKKGGWQVIFNPTAQIIHYGGQTCNNLGKQLIFEKTKGLLNFYRKHKSSLENLLLKKIILFTSAIGLLKSYILKNRSDEEFYKKMIEVTIRFNKIFPPRDIKLN